MAQRAVAWAYGLLLTGFACTPLAGADRHTQPESIAELITHAEPVTVAQPVRRAGAEEPWMDAPDDRAAVPLTSARGAEDENAEQTALARNADRLDQLRKPLSQIRVDATTDDDQSPTNIAAQWLDFQERRPIVAGGVPVPLHPRYTVSSCHRPLYFEELNLERCGHTYGCATNLVSGFYFLTNTAMLPYRLGTDRADCPVPSHGDCRSCQSYSHDIEPFGVEPRGILFEAAAAAGFVFLAM